MVTRAIRPALLGASLLAIVVAGCAAAGLPSENASPTPGGSPPTGAATPVLATAPAATATPPRTPAESPAPTGATPAPPATPGAVLVGAGDIGACGTDGPAATARVVRRVIDDHPDAVVFTAGDNAYSDGSIADFDRCYDPWWGAFRERTRPAAGNHEWHTEGAAGYRAYFGDRAGTKSRTWYAYDAGSWRVIVLDSNCDEVGGCGPSSPQGSWLAEELAAHPVACALAIWHHPRFSSGPHGNQEVASPLFDALYVAGADVVVGGHDHDYERFAPQDPAGRPDPVRGVRQFVVGTGGAQLYPTLFPRSNSEVRRSWTFGVLVLQLAEGGYTWRFEAAGEGSFTDSGAGTCH
ncbi:MAG: metallophosphoesterase [Chloroflexi bacterium]|nr:metallophosphoesterase [Chloroflexota bacterium]